MLANKPHVIGNYSPLKLLTEYTGLKL